jgi:hypothetical protein
MADNDGMRIYISKGSAVAQVEQPSAADPTKAERYTVNTKTLGKLLMGLEGGVVEEIAWVDLLGASSPGVAISVQKHRAIAVVSFPARIRTVQHTLPNDQGRRQTREVVFPLPPTVWIMAFAADRTTLTNAWLWCSETRVTSMKAPTPCWVFPYGNAHAGSGNVCWGNVTLRGLSLEDPLGVDNLFFGTGFNDHLLDLTVLKTADGGNFESLRECIDYVHASRVEGAPQVTHTTGWRTPFATWVGTTLGAR